MDFFDCLQGRRSIRKFQTKQIDRSVFEELAYNASFSPSWKNTQIARYIVVEDRAIIEKLANECVLGFDFNSKTMLGAPALVLVTMVKNRSGFERDGSFSTSKGDRWEMFDAGIATQSLCLSAHAMGLGTVVLGVFDEAEVAKYVAIPENQQLAAIVPIGYPDETPAAPKRKEASELVSFI